VTALAVEVSENGGTAGEVEILQAEILDLSVILAFAWAGLAIPDNQAMPIGQSRQQPMEIIALGQLLALPSFADPLYLSAT